MGNSIATCTLELLDSRCVLHDANGVFTKMQRLEALTKCPTSELEKRITKGITPAADKKEGWAKEVAELFDRGGGTCNMFEVACALTAVAKYDSWNQRMQGQSPQQPHCVLVGNLMFSNSTVSALQPHHLAGEEKHPYPRSAHPYYRRARCRCLPYCMMCHYVYHLYILAQQVYGCSLQRTCRSSKYGTYKSSHPLPVAVVGLRKVQATGGGVGTRARLYVNTPQT